MWCGRTAAAAHDALLLAASAALQPGHNTDVTLVGGRRRLMGASSWCMELRLLLPPLPLRLPRPSPPPLSLPPRPRDGSRQLQDGDAGAICRLRTPIDLRHLLVFSSMMAESRLQRPHMGPHEIHTHSCYGCLRDEAGRDVVVFLMAAPVMAQVAVGHKGQLDHRDQTGMVRAATTNCKSKKSMEGGVNLSMETNAFDLMFKRGLGGSSDNEMMVIGLCRPTLLSRGFAKTSKHRDYEERSHYYDVLLAAESRAEKANKGVHSQKESPVMHITDLTTVSVKKAKDFLPFLQQPAIQTNKPRGDLQLPYHYLVFSLQSILRFNSC